MKNWYIVQTFSGFEQKVAETLKDTLKKREMNDKIEDVLVPTHEVTEVKRGKRIQRKKKYFPSYVLVKMEMDKELYHMIKNIQKVTGFLGATKGTPMPVPEKEIDKMNSTLPKMTHFILPGGHTTVSFCHIARCVCRRAERLTINLSDETLQKKIILKYLNRLSDYLFVLSRYLSKELNSGEIFWKPDR